MQLELNNGYIRPKMEEGINLIYFNEKLEKCKINIPENKIHSDKIIYNYEEGTKFYLTLYLPYLEEDILNKILEIHTLYEIEIPLTLNDYSYVVHGIVDGLQIISLKEWVKLILAKKSIGYKTINFCIEDDFEIMIKEEGYFKNNQINLLATLGYKIS